MPATGVPSLLSLQVLVINANQSTFKLIYKFYKTLVTNTVVNSGHIEKTSKPCIQTSEPILTNQTNTNINFQKLLTDGFIVGKKPRNTLPSTTS